MSADDDNRFPQAVYSGGNEPDPRFTLANERTFLAWMRTSLAFSAAGIALEALTLPIAPGLRLACALVLVAMGLLAPVQAWVGWMRTERALRHARPLPGPRLAPLTAVGTVVVGVLLVAGIVLP